MRRSGGKMAGEISERNGVEKIDRQVVQFLSETVPGLLAVYRFGSFGTPGEHRESDLDLAFWAETSLSNIARWNLVQALARSLGRDVDLVDLAKASTVLRMQVIAHGVCLYRANEALVGSLEDFVFSAYARLNEERREILKDVRRRGSVYDG